MSKPTVSIIIPAYNAGQYIEETLMSCLTQEGEFTKEIIVIDDHSTDQTVEIVNRLILKNSTELKLLINSHKGAQSARNMGIDASIGSYIQFLDADDTLSYTKIQDQLNILQGRNNMSVASCTWIHFKDSTTGLKTRRQAIDKSYKNPIDWLVDSWNGKGMGQTAIWLIPRPLVLKAGYFDETLKMNQDGEYFARILMHSDCILFSEKSFVYYRKPSSGNVSTQKSKEAIASVLKSYKKYEAVLDYNDSEKVKSALFQNYRVFVYQYYNRHRELADRAIEYCKNLGFTQFNWDESVWFTWFARLVGYKAAFLLRNTIKGY